jgi:hypothetical protein
LIQFFEVLFFDEVLDHAVHVALPFHLKLEGVHGMSYNPLHERKA